MIHLVTWFRLRNTIPESKAFHIENMRYEDGIGDIGHQQFGDRYDEVRDAPAT